MKSDNVRVVLVVLAAAVLLFAAARDAAAEIRFGAVAGLNWSTLGGDAPDEAKYRRIFAFAGGVAGEVRLTEDLSLCVQPMYVTRGADIAYNIGEDEPRDSLELRMDYVDCLVLAKVRTDGKRFYVSGGLGFAFLTKANLKNIRDGESDVKSLVKDYDLSAVFGVGYTMPARKSLLAFELRYQQSLLSIADSDELNSPTGLAPRMRFSGVQLFLAVMFPGVGK